jgi:hypothetical protein
VNEGALAHRRLLRQKQTIKIIYNINNLQVVRGSEKPKIIFKLVKNADGRRHTKNINNSYVNV